MRIDDEPAFVLHVRPWRETSLLVEVLSLRHGRLGLLARGVQGPRRQALRAALQPLQWVRLAAVQRGELAQLRAAEALDAAPRPAGAAMLSGFYVNELMLRLLPRQDPLPEVYAAYARIRARLGDGQALAWPLRMFEYEVLQALGVGFDLEHDVDGQPVDPAARYRLDPAEGPRRVLSERGGGERRDLPTGRALLALAAAGAPPPAADMPALRRGMRGWLLHHLGGRGLNSWEMLEALAQRG
ncbi:DNA repair protein RecO [Xanthomonas massiliensis]|uniref:DNA repair protein RecO n=1 Tax=Xanthomonas massiliensis TaxID=1720302 RepID=UPI000826A766|nr:DNA repair protein RecO [Xanthomonas massiliensis]